MSEWLVLVDRSSVDIDRYDSCDGSHDVAIRCHDGLIARVSAAQQLCLDFFDCTDLFYRVAEACDAHHVEEFVEALVMAYSRMLALGKQGRLPSPVHAEILDLD